MMSGFFGSERGFSMVEVMVSVSISVTMILAVMTATHNTLKGVQGAQQKVEFLDAQYGIAGIMRNSAICLDTFKNLRINTVPLVPNFIGRNRVRVPLLREGPTATAPIYVQEGVALRGNSKVIIEKMELTNFESTGVPNQVAADLIVRADPASLQQALRPIVQRLYFNLDVTDPPTSKRPVGCGGITEASVVQLCPDGSGSYCVDGKSFYFTNAGGIRTGNSPTFLSTTEFEVNFMSDSPRFARVRFKYQNGNLKYTAVPGYRVQMCYIPGVGAPACLTYNPRFPGDGDTRNCMAPIFWRGSISGNTARDADPCGPTPPNWFPLYPNNP